MPVITGISGGGASAVVQFVDSIATTPAVRFDFNDLSPAMVVKIDLSPPPMRRGTSSTFLADGDFVTATAHGNRQIRIDLEMEAASSDSAAAALSVLAFELNRDNNILLVQIGSFKTFYRTYRSTEFTLDMLNFDTTYTGEVITVSAEPYGLGLPIQVATAASISSDPTAGGRCLDFNGIVGDVETPLQLALQTSFTPWGFANVGVRRRGTPTNVAHYIQAESMTVGPDTVVAGSHDAGMSGTGNNYTRTSFAGSPGLNNRVTYMWPPAPSVDARGSYRVFARVRRGVGSGDVVTMTAVYAGVGSGLVATVPTFGGGSPFLIDLGVITVPSGTDPVTQGYSNIPMAVAPDALQIQIGRVSGTETIDLDYVYLVPADDCFTSVKFDPRITLTTGAAILDNTADIAYHVSDITTNPWTVVPSVHVYTGSLPMLSPGNNRVYILVALSTQLDNLGSTVTAWAWYWPRYLTVATA